MEDYNDPYQDDNQAEPYYPPSQNKSKVTWLVVGIIIFIMALGTVAFILTNNSKGTESTNTEINSNENNEMGPNNIILNVLTSKDSYEIHEEVTGEYFEKRYY